MEEMPQAERLAEIAKLLKLDNELPPAPDDRDDLFGAELVLTVGEFRRLRELLGIE